VARLKADYGGQPEIDHLLEFIAQSKRGLTR
jgi:UDP-N-acetylglucosamine acyltransferase